jgi:hypothetical protein
MAAFTADPNNSTVTATLAVSGNLVEGSIENFDRIAVQLTGTWTGTVVFEESNDNATWVSVSGYTPAAPQTETVVSLTANGMLVFRSDARYGQVKFTRSGGTVVAYVHARRIGTFAR